MSELLAQLRQRKLVQWAVAYAAGAWVLLQVLSLVAGTYDWPPLAMRVAIAAVATGFLVVLVLAWYHGERGAQRVSGSELLILALLLAIGGVVTWRIAPSPRAPSESGKDSFAVTGMPARDGTRRPESDSESLSRRSIAVLPFENLSDDKANAYFASGMQDMILTKLAAIGELKVISRTSTEKYASRPDDLKLIAQQLGVGTILEGSVQKSGNEVLINVQLIDAGNDKHLWAEAYPRTLENLFGVEGEVAQKIADALKTRLTPTETASVNRLPTQNAAAYDAFLKGEYELQRAEASWQQQTFLSADADYLKAIELDPGFALAHAKLAYCRMRRHWFATPLTAAELGAVKASIDRAFVLAPDLADAHLSLGFYEYWGFRRYEPATAAFQRTLQLAPSSVDALAGLAFVARRMGRWQESYAYMEKALLVSPRDGNLRGEFGATLACLRRYDEAVAQLKLALEFAPTNANAKDFLLQAELFGFGDSAAARAAYRQPPEWRIAALNVLAGDVAFLINTRIYPDVFDRRFAEALEAWDEAPVASEEERRIGQTARVVIRLIAGQHDDALREDCQRLAPALRAALAGQPDALGLLQQTAWVEICLGRNAEALGAARRAVALMPVEKDAYNGGVNALVGLAQVAAHADAIDESLAALRRLLSIPAGSLISVQRLKLDPVWDPLRKDPRFQTLIADSEPNPKQPPQP